MTLPFVRDHDDIYVTDEFLSALHNRCQLALRAAPRGSYISHHTAAVLCGLWPPVSPTIHVSVPPRAGRSMPPGVSAHRGRFEAWKMRVGDLPVSAPPQTVVDLSRTLKLIDLVLLMDSLLGRTEYETRHVRACMSRTNIYRRDLLEAMKLARPLSGSAMESRMRLLAVKGGFPALRSLAW